jgi:hypothetical protein
VVEGANIGFGSRPARLAGDIVRHCILLRATLAIPRIPISRRRFRGLKYSDTGTDPMWSAMLALLGGRLDDAHELRAHPIEIGRRAGDKVAQLFAWIQGMYAPVMWGSGVSPVTGLLWAPRCSEWVTSGRVGRLAGF